MEKKKKASEFFNKEKNRVSVLQWMWIPNSDSFHFYYTSHLFAQLFFYPGQ